MNASSMTKPRSARVLGAAAALILGSLAFAPGRADGQSQSACTLTASPTKFEAYPPGAARPGTLAATFSSALVLFQNAAGANRMMMNETFGYSILDLTNPASPYALKYDDFRFDPASSTTNPLTQSGDGQSAIQTFGVSPDGQRAAIAVNGPFGAWNTLAARSDGGDGFGLWGDFPPSRPYGTVVQHVNGRYIAYAVHQSNGMTAADITTLPTSVPQPLPSLNIPYDQTALPPAYAPPLLLKGNYLVYRTGTYPNAAVTVIDASNPGNPGAIASAFKTVSIPYLTSDPNHRAPANFTAALDPGDATKLWILIEVSAASGEKAPSYGLVAVTKDGTGNLTAAAAPGLFGVPWQPAETWGNAGYASALVAQNGNLFVVMWAQRSLPSQQFGFYATTASAWTQTPPAGLPFQQVAAPGFNLPATNASALGGGGVAPAANVFQYFPTGLAAYADPARVRARQPEGDEHAHGARPYGVAVPNNGTVFIGDEVDITAGRRPAADRRPRWLAAAGGQLRLELRLRLPLGRRARGRRRDAANQAPDNAAFGSPGPTPSSPSSSSDRATRHTRTSGFPVDRDRCWTVGPEQRLHRRLRTSQGPKQPGRRSPRRIAMEAQQPVRDERHGDVHDQLEGPGREGRVHADPRRRASLVERVGRPPDANGYKWYFGDTPTNSHGLLTGELRRTASCVPSRTSRRDALLLADGDIRQRLLDAGLRRARRRRPAVHDRELRRRRSRSTAPRAAPSPRSINNPVNVVNNSQRGSGITRDVPVQPLPPAGPCADNYLPFTINDSSGATGTIPIPATTGDIRPQDQGDVHGWDGRNGVLA